MNFNERHPELRKNREIFLMNIIPSMFNEYKKSGWDIFKKLRTGKIAYDNTGRIVKHYVPMFGIPQ